MGKKPKGDLYVVTSKLNRWDFLNGYSAESQSKDHFIRHLGYRFSKLCSMYELNNASSANEIHIDILKLDRKASNITAKFDFNIVDSYWTDYGYILEMSNSNTTYIREFTSHEEAMEWYNSQK